MKKNLILPIKTEISMLGFGAMRLPTLQNGEVDEMKSQILIESALKSGINYFDTAWMYHNGKSESVLGKVLSRYPRCSYNIASKMPTWNIFDEKKMSEIFDEQLNKCRVTFFDFYLVHCINENTYDNISQIYFFLKQKKELGLIRYLGFSFHGNPRLLKKVLELYKWDFAQIQVNYLDWTDSEAKEQYEILSEKNLPIIIMEPARGGELAKLNKCATSMLNASCNGRSIASWAFRYLFGLKNILTILSGMTNVTQLKDNIKTFNEYKKLTDIEYQLIQNVIFKYKTSRLIKCTHCDYCALCPVAIPISTIFNIYNDYILSGSMLDFKKNIYQYLTM